MRVGFIGLGLMGSGMTNNLQKAGHQLVLHDLRREAAEKLIANGAEWAVEPARRRGVGRGACSPRCPARRSSRRWRPARTA